MSSFQPEASIRRTQERTGSFSVQDVISFAVTGRDSSMLIARIFSPGVGSTFWEAETTEDISIGMVWSWLVLDRVAIQLIKISPSCF